MCREFVSMKFLYIISHGSDASLQLSQSRDMPDNRYARTTRQGVIINSSNLYIYSLIH